MKKLFWFIVPIVILACNQLIPTPNDFPPPPPITPIVEFPQVTATTTLEPRLRPILPEDMQNAETFFLILKTSIAAGDAVGVARMMKYPLRVHMNGQDVTTQTQQDFMNAYDQIFDPEFVAVIFNIHETELTLLPDGIQAGKGELWFNYYCVDLACLDAQFLITQINK